MKSHKNICVDISLAINTESIESLEGLLKKGFSVEQLHNRDNSNIFHELSLSVLDEADLLQYFNTFIKHSEIQFKENHSKIIKSMLDCKTISEGLTPLQLCVINSKPKLLKEYLHLGADPHVTYKNNWTLAHFSSTKGHPLVTMMCYHYNIDLDEKDVEGNTALHLSVANGKDMNAILLIALGAKLDCQNNEGNTPLHIAALKSNYRSTRQLLINGASRKIANKAGVLPKDLPDVKTEIHSMIIEPGFFSGLNPVKLTLEPNNNPKKFLTLILILYFFMYISIFLMITQDLDYEFGIGIVVLFVLSFATLISTLFKDPGFVKKGNKKDLMMLYEQYSPQAICPFCVCVRDPGTRHCFKCRSCVINYDHHCPWIRRCVGKNNIKLFFYMLTTVCVNLLFNAVFGVLDLAGKLPSNEFKKIFKCPLNPYWELKVVFVVLVMIVFLLVSPIWYITFTNIRIGATTFQRYGYLRARSADPHGNFKVTDQMTESFIDSSINNPIVICCR